jgi:hypothetical protein
MQEFSPESAPFCQRRISSEAPPVRAREMRAKHISTVKYIFYFYLKLMK